MGRDAGHRLPEVLRCGVEGILRGVSEGAKTDRHGGPAPALYSVENLFLFHLARSFRDAQFRAARAWIARDLSGRRGDRFLGQNPKPPCLAGRAGGGPGWTGAPTGEAQEGMFDGSIIQGVEGNGAESTCHPECLRRIWNCLFKVQ